MILSIQLFCAHKFKTYIPLIEEAGKMGYDAVEAYSANFEDRKNIRLAMDKAGVTMPTIHMPLELIESALNKAVEVARDFGVQTMYVPGVHGAPTDFAGCAALARRLSEAQKKVTDLGFGFGWHNHTHELGHRVEDGRTVMEVLLTEAPTIEWQSDITWVAEGGGDPLEWTGRYSNRVTSLQFRDLAQSPTAPGPLGHLLAWDAYFAPERNSKISTIVVEHEAQPTVESLYAFAKEIADTYKALKK